MDGRSLLTLVMLAIITVVLIGAWRTEALTRECAKHGGSYSLLERRCKGTQPKVIIQRDLMRS